jgi:hypothetical protein
MVTAPLPKPGSDVRDDGIPHLMDAAGMTRAEAMETLNVCKREIPGGIVKVKGPRTHASQNGALPFCFMVTAAGKAYISKEVAEGRKRHTRGNPGKKTAKRAAAKKTADPKPAPPRLRPPRATHVLDEVLRSAKLPCTGEVLGAVDAIAARHWNNLHGATKNVDPATRLHTWMPSDVDFLANFVAGNV